MWAKGSAAIIAVGAIIVLVVAIQNLIAFQRSLPNIITAGRLKRVEPSETSIIAAERLCRRGARDYLPLAVTLEAHRLRPDRGVLEGTLRFDPVAKYRKTRRGFEKMITPPHGLVFPRGSKIRVRVTDTFGSRYEAFSFPTSRLRVSTLSKPTRGVVRPATFSVISWSRMYPLDRYLVGVELDIDLIGTDPRSRARSLPANCNLGMGADFTDTVVTAQVRSPRTPGFLFDLERKTSTRVFVWLVALSPLVFALMVLHGLVFRSLTPQSFGVGTGLALLSIFSLRQVVVPDEIPGITLIDLVLGAEVAAMVALAAIAYFFASGRPAGPAPPESAASEG